MGGFGYCHENDLMDCVEVLGGFQCAKCLQGSLPDPHDRTKCKGLLNICNNQRIYYPSQNRRVILQDFARVLQESCKNMRHLARSCEILAKILNDNRPICKSRAR